MGDYYNRNLNCLIPTALNRLRHIYYILHYITTRSVALTVDKGTLSPEFNPETRLYTVDLDESQTNITISATGPNSITGTGLYSLDLGANVFEVISTNNVGDENVYRVVVI